MEDCFRHAIDCARRQGAEYSELAAALSLSRLWRGQGKHDTPSEALAKEDDARTLLAEIYGWFTDTSAGGLRSAGGFETRDLKEAKVLLEELR